jgi:hypothetical protein
MLSAFINTILHEDSVQYGNMNLNDAQLFMTVCIEEVPESVFERRGEETVTIRLPTAEVEVVKRLAKAKGMGHTALIQEWVREKLQHA